MIRVGVVGIGGYGGRLIERIRRVSDQAGVRVGAAADTRLADLPEAAATSAFDLAGYDAFPQRFAWD